MFRLRSDVYDYLAAHQQATPRDLQDVFELPGRTARRHVRRFRSGDAVRVEIPIEVAAKAASMENYDPDGVEWDLEAFLDEAPRLVQEQQKRDPNITHDTHTFAVDYPIGIMFVSCMHLGGVYTAYPEFRTVFEKALQIPRLYWAMLGDDIEGFPEWFRDVPAVRNQLMPVNHQIELLETVLEQIKDQNKLLFGCGSQHGGKWLKSRTGENPIKSLYMDKLGVPFYDGPAYLKLEVGKEIYKIAVAHEFPGNSQYNPTHPQKRASMTRFPLAEVVVMGDKHNSAMQRVTTYQDEYEAGDRPSNNAWFLQVGTAKTGPDAFTLEHGFPKGVLGWPVMVFHNNQHIIEQTDYLDRAEHFLNSTLSKP